MSRIGQKPISVPDSVEVDTGSGTVTVSGPEGELSREIHHRLDVTYDDDNQEISVENHGNTTEDRAMHGTTRSLIANMVKGVSQGFEETLRIRGTGYSARQKGDSLEVEVGHTDDKVFDIPESVSVEIPNATTIELKGPDKEVIGQFAAEIRAIRPPDTYTEKGIRYEGEQVRTKEGKKFVSGV